MVTKISEEVKKKAIEVYATCGVLVVAAKAAGVSRSTLWKESKRNAKFKNELEEAKGTYTDILESILNKRIKEGKSKMSDVLLMFALKAQMPEKYRERVEHKVHANIKIISGVPRPGKPKEKKKA